MTEEDPDLLADDGDHDQSRGRSPFPVRLTEELENARYENNLLAQKCRELEQRIEALQKKVEAVEKINGKLTSALDTLREENRQLRELKMQGVVSEPVKATPPRYENLQDLG